MSEEKKEQPQNAQLDPSQWKAGPLAFFALVPKELHDALHLELVLLPSLYTNAQ
mgnify:CR=1 FL=1